jgi:hypothetical protein
MKYQFNFKETFNTATDFSREYIFNKITLRSVLFSFIFSIIILLLSNPQFSVSATLLENKEPQQGGQLNGLAIAFQTQDDDLYQKFRANVFSSTTAKDLWIQGWGSKIFDSNNKFEDDNKIIKPQGLFTRFNAFLLGYDLNPYYSHLDLKSYIARKVGVRKAPRSSDFTVMMFTVNNKEQTENFIYDLIITADSDAKQKALRVSRARIQSAMSELKNPKNSFVNNALSSVLNAEYFKVASLSNDLPYYVYFVDMPNATEHPVSPNAFAVFLADIIIFFIFGIMFSYVSKNKEELW